jgi:predicted PurR-regulated permease PerM
MKTYPTPWQRKILWWAFTALAITFFFALAACVLLAMSRVLGFLQPLLIPVAVAGVLAYLLDPVVNFFCSRGISRTTAVIYVFMLILLPLILLCLWIIPEIYHQSLQFASKVPGYVEKSREMLMDTVERYQELYAGNPYVQEAGVWLQNQLPTLPPKIWSFISSSVEGFLGIFGFVLGLVVVPIYLFFFLKDGAEIAEHWSDYLPLRASEFKNEVVAVLTEINRYLISFFRGQLLVSIIDGVATGVLLLLLGLDFALLIGLLICVLALIPYIGVILCWIPAVLIAAVQFGDWFHPLMVTAIFVGVQQLEGWLIAPKIVGESVGLHPLTVIISVFAWTLLIGGLLGAILAVPLTATLKVLLVRYIWQEDFQSVDLAPAPELSQKQVLVASK